MTRRPYHRPPEGRHRDRTDRRAVVDVLLARAQRGALSRTEGALLAEHVREEQRLADENRRAMAGTTQALERVRAQLTAAEQAEQQLADIRAALPDEPRPRLGLPNDLAYEDGRHDMADAVRHFLSDDDQEQPEQAPAECEIPLHTHQTTKPGPECRVEYDDKEQRQ